VPLREYELSEPVTFVLGAEREGLPDSVVRGCESRVSIPLEPRAESLNVAVAAAIALHERRRSAG
jgi:tRNA G18 (ribose-2'-O)-methylase SpoU